jgi:hypothetical protein
VLLFDAGWLSKLESVTVGWWWLIWRRALVETTYLSQPPFTPKNTVYCLGIRYVNRNVYVDLEHKVLCGPYA